MTWLRRVIALFPGRPAVPPAPQPDPELPAHRLRATRVLAKADRAIERRRRLDAALDHAGQAIRGR